MAQLARCHLCGQKIRGMFARSTLCQNCIASQQSLQAPHATSSSASAEQPSGRSLEVLQSALSEARLVREACLRAGRDEEASAASEIVTMLEALIWQQNAERTQQEALAARALPRGTSSRSTADWEWEAGVTPQLGQMYFVDYDARTIREKPSRAPSRAPASSFSLRITQPPCFDHGIGGRSYSQICSSVDGNELTRTLSDLADACSFLQASERWRLGLERP